MLYTTKLQTQETLLSRIIKLFLQYKNPQFHTHHIINLVTDCSINHLISFMKKDTYKIKERSKNKTTRNHNVDESNNYNIIS